MCQIPQCDALGFEDMSIGHTEWTAALTWIDIDRSKRERSQSGSGNNRRYSLALRVRITLVARLGRSAGGTATVFQNLQFARTI